MIEPYIIIPNLIFQPTWGGKYICRFKKITNKNILNKNIGQSYELYEHTRFSNKKTTLNKPTFEIGSPSNPKNAHLFGNEKPINIQNVININPAGVLGEKAISVHGNKMGVLIKFTQAKGNSYQLHVKEAVDKWKPKPESWYYLEPGIITLGVKKGIDWAKYKNTCLKINDSASKLSIQIKKKKKSIDNAKIELKNLIKKLNPENFVNVLEIKKNQGIDLSKCGIHHSWEESLKYPNGNIVYEVQKNVYDPSSTIRCFDKGKIKDDGSIRQLQIEDYFKYIRRADKENNPYSYINSIDMIKTNQKHTISKIFNSKQYCMDEISISKGNMYCQTSISDSFHHIFIREGKIDIKTSNKTITLTKGYSAFIPASTGKYNIISRNKTVILKTYV